MSAAKRRRLAMTALENYLAQPTEEGARGLGRLAKFTAPRDAGEPAAPTELDAEHRAAFLDGFRDTHRALAWLGSLPPIPEPPVDPAPVLDLGMPASGDTPRALADAIHAYDNRPTDEAAAALGRMAAIYELRIGHEPAPHAWRTVLPQHMEAYGRGRALERLRAAAPRAMGEPHD